MDKAQNKTLRRQRRHTGIRKRVAGTPARPRLAVYKSLKHIYAQVIDDLAGHTIVAASTLDTDAAVERGGNAAAAAAVGKLLASRAKSKGVTAVVFDRGGFRYHGRIKALADAARSEGLTF